ncbi:hypothetical protein ACHAWO_000608 [Cyclotella atomus]|uniref:Uncharacterized protein n=1 Tax=Cyclotella atomus TaxID=382360 RepID=A0ABD3NA87_9STRA
MDSKDSPPRPPIRVAEASSDQQETRGHVRTHTPFESPARASRPPMPSTPGGMQYNVPSTPGPSIGFAPGTPCGAYGAHFGSKMAAEMNTPVISNANTKYVDDDQGKKGYSPPSQFGLPTGRPLVDKSTSYGVSATGLAPRSCAARARPQPFLKQSGATGGLGIITSLAMPSALYSDDSSLEEGAANERILRPVELKPNRFHSFQGQSQYERKKITHPMTLSPALEHPNTGPGASSGQYMPNIRNAHGVKELSDTKDLDAIFKADRPTPSRSTAAVLNSKMVSPMSVDDDDDDEDEEERQEHLSSQLLGDTIPIDDREWSIPSIRLANHVNTFGLDGSVHSYHTLFSDEEDYTDDGGSSYDGSFIDDDDASLSSKESYDKVRRWRRMSGVLRRGSQSQAVSGEDDDVVMKPPPQVTRTLHTPTSDLDGAQAAGASLLEQRFGDFAIDNTEPSTNVPPTNTSIFGPPPILNITAPVDDNAVNYASPSHERRRRRRHKKKGRSHSHSALEWIHGLQQNNASEGGQIIEAASSKFLTGASNRVDQAENQDTKALGMSHPLCRSSTIEAGGFAYGVEA